MVALRSNPRPAFLLALARGPGFRQSIAAWARDRSGAVTVTVALALSALVGFAALGTEAAGWYVTKRNMQGAADSAAYSAAMAKAAGAATADYVSEAKSVAGGYSYVDGKNQVTVTVNSPPQSGSHATNNSAVEVIITRSQPLVLASLFLGTSPTLKARAVALPGASGCVLALDQGAVTDVTDNGNTVLNLNGCNIYVNSPATAALKLVGGATINANAAYIHGNYTTSGQAVLNTTAGTYTSAPVADDPYADVQIPSYSGCNSNNYSLTGGSSQTFTPGSSGVWVFCGGFDVKGNSSVTLQPGVYIIDGGSFSIAGGSSVSGSGVTIILTSSSGSGYATASVAGGAILNITAPNSGPLAGLAFFQDRTAPASGSDSFTGGATQNITGAIYFPNQNVTFAGGTATGAKCTQLVALTLTFNGNASFNFGNDCAGTGVRGAGTALVQLVE
jgi:Flp pilus assembly protein TadG